MPFSLANVPAIQHFVARENELLELQKSLVGDGTRHVAVLHGLGGIGKTQLAIAYAKGYRDNYSAVFWLNIKDEVSAKQGFIRIAGQILQSHPTASPFTSIDLQKDQDKVVEAVKAWLSLPSNTRWLMIYDNYDTPRLANTTVPGDVDIRQFLPDAYQGSVIVTTRSAQVDLGHLIRIRRLEFIDDSLGILERILGTENLKSDPDAVELANELDGLPLALATAGAYLHRVPTSFGDYLRLYKESWARLHNSTPSLGSYEDRTLCSTWQLSYKTIEEQHKSAAGLLRWWAYFDNQDLWYELVKHTDSASPGWMLELIKDELCFNDAIGILNEYGLVERNGADTRAVRPAGYNMHSCVHSWVYHVLNEEPDPNLERLAMVCVASHVPLPDMFYLESHALPPDMIKASKIQKRLLSHALRWNSVARNETCNDMEWAFHNLGLLFDNERWLQNAEEMYLRALDLCEKTWGPDHSPIFITAHNLGNVYTNQGRLPEAEKMLIRARQGKEKAWGPDHISTLSTVILLGNLYKVRGDFHKAEDMFVQAIQGYEKTQGPGRIMLFETLNNLGYLYAEHGKPRKAEEMYLRAIEGFEKARGSGYTSIHRVILNLGILYTKQGKLQKAEKIWLRALHAREKAWGSNHVKTLDVIASLAYLYHSQGRLQEAEDMSLKALQGYEVAMGPDHIHKCWPALNSLQHLGDLAVIAGMPARAHEMYTRAFYGLELWLGPSDVRVAHIQDTLDSLEKSMSKKPRMKGKGLLEQRLTESAAGDAGAQNTTSKVRKSMQRFTEFMQRK